MAAATINDKPPQKRRKLSGATAPTNSTTSSLPKIVIPTNTKPSVTLGTCTSCHRTVASNAQTQLISCERWAALRRWIYIEWVLNHVKSISIRCSMSTCAVCSRTCTASAPSQPPTPHLTWSASPSPTPSPRRSILALNSANTNQGASLTVPGNSATSNARGKRRKGAEDDDPAVHGWENNPGVDSEDIGPGCGRTLCRNCCFENMQRWVVLNMGFLIYVWSNVIQ